MDASRGEFTVAILGGGFTGAVLAIQLLRRGSAGLRVVVVERQSPPGRGVAYSTPYNWHLLNVPAGKMSMFADDPGHFVRWARRSHDPMVREEDYLPRRVYGQYVESTLCEAQNAGAAQLEWIAGEALSAEPAEDGVQVELRSGRRVAADVAVLAVGNLRPSDPSLPGLPIDHPRYIRYAWSASAMDGVERERDVVLVGSGLTAVDTVMSLRAHGFKGTVHLVSRRGLLPHPQAAASAEPWRFEGTMPRTARGLVRLVRRQMQLSLEQGRDWRSVIDGLRPFTAQVWQRLPPGERKRFLRHVRAHWEVVRHRIPPPVAKLLGYQLTEGKVRVYAGWVVRCEQQGERLELRIRERRSGQETVLAADRIVNCTGPETDCRRLDDPLLVDMRAQGWIRPDELFLGLDVTPQGRVRDRDGRASGVLYAAGPARKGQLWETTAVPELRVQVEELARHLLQLALYGAGAVATTMRIEEFA
jgi:uncharacterized NAD(P)/FAD-binding protein YdhS